MKEDRMDQIGYGIVGFGGIAENRIAKEGFGLDRSRFSTPLPMKLIGATDINPQRQSAAAALGLGWYDSLSSMLEDERIQAVYVATSNSTHYETARQSLLSGRHVMIEKPLTTSLEQAHDLMAIAEKRSLSISVNLMMTKNSYNLKARELLKDGAVGSPDYALMHMEFLYGEDPQEASAWRCADPKEYGGPIGDVGGHCLDMAEFLFGEKIISVQCVYYPPSLNINVESGALILYTLKNGMRGCVRAAFNQPRGGLFGTLNNLGYEIYGDTGIMRGYGTLFQLSGHSDEPIAVRLEVETPEHSRRYHVSNPVNIYQAHIGEHALSIKNSTPMDGSSGLRNLRLVLACHASAQQGGKETAVDDEC